MSDYELFPASALIALYATTTLAVLAAVPFEALTKLLARSPLVWYYALNCVLWIAVNVALQPEGWKRNLVTGHNPRINVPCDTLLATILMTVLPCSDMFRGEERAPAQKGAGLVTFLFFGLYWTWASFTGGDPAYRVEPFAGAEIDLNQALRTLQMQIGVIALTVAWTAFRTPQKLVFLVTPLVGKETAELWAQ